MSDVLQSYDQRGFSTYVIETKSGEKEYYIEGYIATHDKDLVNDVITKAGMTDIYNQVDNIKMDLEHEAFVPSPEGYGKFGSRDALIPVAKVVEKRLDNIGVWVKAQINPHIDRFQTIWKSIKDGFISAFSIAFAQPKSCDYVMNGDTRMLNSVNLLNVALTGNPVNRGATITNVVAKSMGSRGKEYQKDKEEEESEMSDKKVEDAKTEVKSDVVAEVKEVVEEVKEPTVDVKAVLAELQEIKTLLSSKAEVKAEKKEEAAEVDIKSLIAEVKALKEELAKPQLKAISDVAPVEKAKDFSFMELIK